MPPLSTLFPALAGLFGVAGLLWSLMTLGETTELRIEKNIDLKPGETPLPSLRGGVAGIIVGLLPGLGAANAATLLLLIERWLGRTEDRQYEDRSYLVTTSSLNTSEAIVAITALYLIQKSRSGASIAIGQLLGGDITVEILEVVLISMVAGGIISTLLLWHGGPYLADRVGKMDYPSLNWAVMTFIVVLVGLLLGLGGIAILVAATVVGIMPLVLEVRRGQLMGFFLVPTMLFYSGLSRAFYEGAHLERRQAPGEALEIVYVMSALAGSLLISLLLYRSIRMREALPSTHRSAAEKSFAGIVISGILLFLLLLVA